MEITDWILAHPIDEQLLWKGAASRQMCFVRDDLARLFDEGKKRALVRVVSSHRSKSVELPVYYIDHPLIEVWLRGNFYNWVLSVRALDLGRASSPSFARRLVAVDERAGQVKGIYAEGFSEEWIFPPLARARKGNAFSIHLPYHECVLFTFLYLLTETFVGIGS